MKQIQIQVFQNVDSRTSGRVLFERIVDINDSIKVPYEDLIDSLKFMFGNVIVQFAVL